MAGKIFTSVLLILASFYGVHCASPPVFSGSYIAWGEIVQPISEVIAITLQMTFEESFDADSGNAAFTLVFGGKNLTFVKNYKTNQTFQYLVTEENKLACLLTSEQEWTDSDFEASLLYFEDSKGKIKFSLKQLFDIPDKYLTEKHRGDPFVYRGIDANVWTYEIKTKDKKSGKDATLSIAAYWASGKFATSAGKKVSPLGFNVSKIIWTEPDAIVEDYIVNVYGFVPDTYDHKYFKAVEGIKCDGRVQTLKFPNVRELKAISIYSEMAMPDYQEVRYTDTHFDPMNKLIRVDVERLKNEDPTELKNRRYQSEIAIGKMGVVYRFSSYKGESSCDVIPFSQYENDMQNFFDVKQSLSDWKIGRLFGLNSTTYVYTGKTVKNDIPCHMFQGERNDWPDKASGIISQWEWCFNVNMSKENDIMMFRDDEFGMVSAQVIILTHPTIPTFEGYRMNHHFYEVKAQEPKILDFTKFDISRCYKDLQRRGLQFSLDVAFDYHNRTFVENATSDIDFLQKWKAAVYQAAKLPYHSLRISNLRSTIDDGKMFIKFNILDIHNDLPSDVKKAMISSDEAEKNLQAAINADGITVMHQWKKGETIEFKSEKNSLSYQIDPTFEIHTVAPLKSTTPAKPPTRFPFSLKTPEPKTPEPKTPEPKTPEPTNEAKRIVKRFLGNQPGTVFGVSIAMLLVGVTIGSAGTFYKFNGLPTFMRR